MDEILVLVISLVCSIFLTYLVIRKIRNRGKLRVDVLFPNMTYKSLRLKIVDGFKISYKNHLIPVGPSHVFKHKKLKGGSKLFLNGADLKPIRFSTNPHPDGVSELFNTWGMKRAEKHVGKLINLGFSDLKNEKTTFLLIIMGLIVIQLVFIIMLGQRIGAF